MKTSWYKEPWAWLVFFLPLSAVIAGITTLIIANTDPDPLVVGDYYKKGKAINLELTKIKHAQKLGMAFALKFDNNELVIKPTGIDKEFPLLNVNFYHPTQQEKDFYFAMTADASGMFRQIIDQDISGKWRITISPFENHWKIQNTITLPQSNFIDILPKSIEAN
ncbi:FixH family protein [Colwellia sp. 1_MG-2023]|uniref:FixH family protein n=1 Tax=Colwellia sp. 1_MG-2023 TaxID=3062649 RepID=UPI0026E11F4F|nr:FixH family protein [Colwellia sp. 1_MG-2023]MDO6446028.1 FixH family protein [Colwellia sp. 1_MG-2023]